MNSTATAKTSGFMLQRFPSLRLYSVPSPIGCRENEVFWLYATSVASFVKRIFCIGFSVPVNRIPEAISSQIARLLKAEREKRGISLNLLAQKAGVNRQTVAFVEQGLRNPTLNTLFRLTSALEVEPEKIIARARKLAGG
jgi:DNA-binding XRE family transcriptional regulator